MASELKVDEEQLNAVIKFDFSILVNLLRETTSKLNDQGSLINTLIKEGKARDEVIKGLTKELNSAKASINICKSDIAANKLEMNLMREENEAHFQLAEKNHGELSETVTKNHNEVMSTVKTIVTDQAKVQRDIRANTDAITVCDEAVRKMSQEFGAKMAQVSRQMDKQKDDMDKILDTVKQNDERLTNCEENVQEQHEKLEEHDNSLTNFNTVIPAMEKSVKRITRDSEFMSNTMEIHGRDIESMRSELSAIPNKAEKDDMLKNRQDLAKAVSRLNELEKAVDVNKINYALDQVTLMSNEVETLSTDQTAKFLKLDGLYSNVETLAEELKEVKIEVNGGSSGKKLSHEYVDKLYDDLLSKMNELKRNNGKSTKTELKRFERDIMQFLEEQRDETAQTQSAGGRVHFRCISCNQFTPSQPGASTDSFKSSTVPLFTASSIKPNMHIERGSEEGVTGRDGLMYKGRSNSAVDFSPTSGKFKVAFSDKFPGNRPKPSIFDPAPSDEENEGNVTGKQMRLVTTLPPASPAPRGGYHPQSRSGSTQAMYSRQDSIISRNGEERHLRSSSSLSKTQHRKHPSPRTAR